MTYLTYTHPGIIYCQVRPQTYIFKRVKKILGLKIARRSKKSITGYETTWLHCVNTMGVILACEFYLN